MKKSSTLTGIMIISFVFAAYMMFRGFDKMTNYNSPDSYGPSKNAYVGGDAYNYIINGNYATGYFVLAVGGLLSGVICIGCNEIIARVSNATMENNYRNRNDEDESLPPL